MNSIRNKRRNRWRHKAELQRLDAIAQAAIDRSFTWKMDTWGGTRCADCGVGVRPHHLVNYSRSGPGFHLSGHGTDCAKVGNCKGETPGWWAKASEKY